VKHIHPLLISRFIGVILIIESISFLACIPVALIYKESIIPFIVSALTGVTLALFLYLPAARSDTLTLNIRDIYLLVVLSWIAISSAGSLPYIVGSATKSFIDAFFESTSGFTTTGSSIFNDVESLPHSILFYRSLTHWIGGFGIISMVIILFPSIRVTGYRLFTLESSLKEKIVPKTRSIIFRLLLIYISLNLGEIILLWAGDMNLFDSVCHAFGTIATGGFSTKNSGLAYYSPYSQYVVMIFMFLAGVSQVVYYYLIKLNFKKLKNNDELFFYIAVVIIAGIIATGILSAFSYKPFETAIREGFFQVISIITCTGFASADYLTWPNVGLFLIFILMFAGGSTGSTSGGIKMARHLIVLKNIKNIFIKLSHPGTVKLIRMNGKALPEEMSISIISFIVLYIVVFLLGTFLLVINGSDLVTSASSSATCMAGIGPGLSTVGPMGNFSHLPDLSKIVLCLLMITGRLEIITVMVIFTRSFWKK